MDFSFIFSNSVINDFSAMALLRQYSLLGLPHTWKASLIHSYGSLLAQQQSQNENFGHQHRVVGPPSSGHLFRGNVPPSNNPPPPPIPPNMAAAAGLPPNPPTLPLIPSAASTQNPPPPLPPPQAPQSSSSPLLQQRKAVTSSCSPRSSPTSSSGGVGQTKQRTYPCNECGKIFNAHYNLTRHMPVHTGTLIENSNYFTYF